MPKISFSLANIIKWLLAATVLMPLVISNVTIYPFVFPKIVFYRILVELALVLALAYFLTLERANPKELLVKFYSASREAVKNPTIVFLFLFFLSLVFSVVLAGNAYRAFWGDLERGVGLFGFLHFYVFLVLVLCFFKEKDWDRFFKLSVAVGAGLIGFAFLEYFGLKFLFLSPPQKARPESLIGNSAFFATHLIFLSAFAFMVFKKSKEAFQGAYSRIDYFWKYFSLVVLILAPITVFMTGTRGAVLGVGAGLISLFIYFAARKETPRLLRLASLGALAFIIVFFGVFWTTRANDFWQNIPGLDRLAKTAAFDIGDPSTQFRLITWRLSWDAFKEKPFFGWGLENYIVAYEKYYDPAYALYGEVWLDRAHNTIFDLLVMQGAFGTFVYLGFFLALICALFKKIGREKERFYLGAVLIAVLSAYFVQNLVLFDQIVSYAAFFVLIGYILHLQKKSVEIAPINSVIVDYFTGKKIVLVLKFAAVVIILLSLYSIFAYNIIPYGQGVAFKKSPRTSQNAYDVEGAIKRAIAPYNFAQYNIRSQGIDTIYMGQYFDNAQYVNNPKFRPLGSTLINMMAELVGREPHDARVHIRLVEMLNGFSRGMSDAEIKETKIYERGEELMRDALKRAPNRQEVYYHLAFNLAAQGKYDEAIETAQKAIDLEPRVARAHYHLGLVLALAGENEESQKAIAKAEELAPNFERFMGTDINNIAIFYKTWGFTDKYAELVYRTLLKINENKIGHVFSRGDYEDALRYYILNKNAERAILIADYLGKNFSDLINDMAEIKKLLGKEDWNKLIKIKDDKEDVSVDFTREYYENELRRHILVKDKVNALEVSRYLLKNYREYALEMGIDVIADLIEKEKWEILHKL